MRVSANGISLGKTTGLGSPNASNTGKAIATKLCRLMMGNPALGPMGIHARQGTTKRLHLPRRLNLG